MNLAVGMKQAVAIAANEVLCEWLEAIAEDPQAVLDGDELGSTYQSFLSPDALPEVEVERMLASVAAFDPGDPTDPAWQRLDRAWFAAAMELARALIALATGVGRVPASVAGVVGELGPLVEVVKDALARGSFDGDVDALLA